MSDTKTYMELGLMDDGWAMALESVIKESIIEGYSADGDINGAIIVEVFGCSIQEYSIF